MGPYRHGTRSSPVRTILWNRDHPNTYMVLAFYILCLHKSSISVGFWKHSFIFALPILLGSPKSWVLLCIQSLKIYILGSQPRYLHKFRETLELRNRNRCLGLMLTRENQLQLVLITKCRSYFESFYLLLILPGIGFMINSPSGPEKREDMR